MPNNQELSPVITEAKLLQFYNTYVKPYINAESGGHEIKNEGDTDPLTQRETMVLQAPLFAEDDSTNETTNLNVDVDADLSSFPVPGNTKAPDMEVYINNPQDGQSIVYNGTNQRWENGGGIHKYSTTEQVVGEWIDGKPVYEKTIIGNNFDNAGKWSAQHNISNLDEVVNVSSPSWFDSSDNCWYSDTRMHFSGSISSSYGIGGEVQITSTGIGIQQESNFSAVDWTNRTEKIRITIQYTKTTDTASS